MSGTGLFLIIFLVVHLLGNLQLLANDGGEAFNIYAEFMTTNPLIKTVSYLLYLSIVVHAVQGILLWQKNKAARGTRYNVRTTQNTKFAARNMAWLGIIIFVFILLHLYQFWLQMKLDVLDYVSYPGHDGQVKNLYDPVAIAFSQWWYVVIYVISMGVIALHLIHGFQSSFQTLGLNHKKYGFVFKSLGVVYSILIPLAFAIIPVYMYFNQ